MGHVYLYYGTGGGKTANALGLTLRSVGHGNRVVIVQFMKHWKETGEFKIMERLKPNYEIRQFGNPGWLRITKGGTEAHAGGVSLDIREPTEFDKARAAEAMRFSRRVLTEEKPDLLVLDEVCLAVHAGLLPVSDVLDLLEQLPENTNVVLTGRYAPKELIDRADFVNEVVEIKSPEKFVMTRGIQY